MSHVSGTGSYLFYLGRTPSVSEVRRETDSLGVVEVPADAQTQRSLEHFSIGQDL